MDTAAAPCLSPTELRALLGRAGAPLLLDVRRTPRFADSDRLVVGARHCPPEQVARLAATETPRDVVVYCAHGHAVSQEAAGTLRAAGWAARYLAGGIEGGEPGVDAPDDLARWRAHPVPTMRKRPEFGVTGGSPSRWITREGAKVDRIACPWLIRRFIDPRATFSYVPASQVASEAHRLGAVPFDTPDAALSHDWERCSFDALLQAFDVADPTLASLATIVRGADTDRLALAPAAAGLLAVSLGLSRLHAGDDAAMLEAAMPVYDALHAWCRDPAERHTWQVHGLEVPA